jgi:hypothetical protein
MPTAREQLQSHAAAAAPATSAEPSDGNDLTAGSPALAAASEAHRVTSPIHQADLKGSVLTEEIWAGAGLYTEASAERIGEALNWKGAARKLGFALVFPYYDLDGKPTVYVRVKPDNPRTDRKTKKPVKYEAPKGKRPQAYFPPLIWRTWKSADPLLITEGEKKALCACQHGFPTIGLSGVWSWKTKDTPILAELEKIPWRGRLVYIAFDSDRTTNDNVQTAEACLADALIERGAIVRVVELQPGPSGEKTGVDDFFARGGTVDEFRELIDRAVNPRAARPKASRGRAAVLLGPDEYRVTAECVKALATDPDLYQRGNEWVRIGEDGDTGAPIIALVGPADLRRRLTAVAELFEKYEAPGGQIEFYRVHPPQWLVPQLAEYPDKGGVRKLVGISTVPLVRPDGTVRTEPGYDAQTQIYFDPGGVEFPAVPIHITAEHVRTSVSQLLDLVGDFPIRDAAGRSVFLSLVLSTLCRHLFDGCVPLHLFDANVRGSGKGLLIDVAGVLAIGGCIPTQAYAHEQPEMRKVITAVVLAGKAVQHLDNLASGGSFGNSALDSALTSTVWSDRLLSTNKQISLPHRTVWCASGNNVAIRADTARRIIRCRMESPLSAPEDRQDFKYPNLLRHVQEHRPELVTHALTIVAGYLRDGRPRQNLAAAGSFVGWSSLIRAVLVWAGEPDPWSTNLSAREEIDTEADELAALISAWEELDPEIQGLTTAAAKKKYEAAKKKCEAASGGDAGGDNPFPMTAELIAIAGSRDFDTSRLGYLLRKHKGRLSPDGKRISVKGSGTKSRKTKAWIVEAASETTSPASGRDRGDRGDVSPQLPFARASENPHANTSGQKVTGVKHPPHATHPPHGNGAVPHCLPQPHPAGCGPVSDETCEELERWNASH